MTSSQDLPCNEGGDQALLPASFGETDPNNK